jgi:ribosome-associated protein
VDEDLHITGSVTIPRNELSWRFSRSSGPGGQGVNTTDSRVQLTFDLARSSSMPELLRARAVERLGSKLVDGCLVVASSEQRSQLQNREAAERRLVDTLRAAMAPPPRKRRPTKPSRASVDRRIKEKKSRGETKRLRRSHDSD